MVTVLNDVKEFRMALNSIEQFDSHKTFAKIVVFNNIMLTDVELD